MCNRLYAFLYTSILILTVSIILIWQTQKNLQYFIDTHRQLEQTVVKNAAAEISHFIHDLQTASHIFAEEYAPSFQYMQAFPNNSNYRQDMVKQMQRRFADYISFSVTNERGQLIYQDQNIHFGKMCEQEVRQYALRHQNVDKAPEYWQNILIHPKTGHYHFDTMSPWKMANGKNQGVLLLGINPKALINILKRQQIPGYLILLVRNNGSGAIEVSPEGIAEDLLGNTNLSDLELKRVYAKADVAGTAWQLLSLPDQFLYGSYEKKLWTEAFYILAILILISLLMSNIIWKITQRNKS